MLNNIFPLIAQAGIQPITHQTVTASQFESAALWIEDVITLYLLGY